MPRPTFSENLDSMLKMNGMLPSELARRLAVNPSQVTQWVKNGREPSAPVLLAMARIFGVDPWVLLGSNAIEPKPPEPAPPRGRPRKVEMAAVLEEDPAIPPIKPRKKS